MLVWLLPTFLWSGEKIDETDRPFAKLPIFGREGVLDNIVKRREGEDLEIEERLANIFNVVTVESSFAKVWNRLFCPQCVARLAVINGVVVSTVMPVNQS